MVNGEKIDEQRMDGVKKDDHFEMGTENVLNNSNAKVSSEAKVDDTRL